MRRGEFELIKCRNCGLIFQYPLQPKAKYFEQIQKHYREVDPTFKVAYSRGMLYSKVLRKIQNLKGKDSRLLDVGCSWGYFLILAGKAGWKAWGIELNPVLAKMGQEDYGLDIRSADFEEADVERSHYEVMTLINVFEEVTHLSACLEKLKECLKPGGTLYIRFHNAEFNYLMYKVEKTLARLGLVRLLPYHSYVFHIANFSKKTIGILMKKSGFQNIKITNSYPSLGDPYGAGKGVKWLKIISFLLAQGLFFLSAKTLMLAPSIEVFAKNGQD